MSWAGQFKALGARAAAAAKRVIKPWLPAQRLRLRLSRTYLVGDGIEVGALHNPLRTTSQARVKYVDRLPRAELLRHYPEMIGTGVVDPDIIDNGETLSKIEAQSLDFIIANNFIEHCEDPIRTLSNFFMKLKVGGVVYLAVPDKRHTFDRERSSTSFDHLEQDHRDGGAASRQAHFVDFARHAHFRNRASEHEVQALANQWLQQSYSIHFHVWDHDEFAAFLRAMQALYLPALEVADRCRNGNENVFILRKAAR